MVALSSREDAATRSARLMQEGAVVGGVPVRVVELSGEAGDLVIGDNWLLHAGAPTLEPAPHDARAAGAGRVTARAAGGRTGPARALRPLRGVPRAALPGLRSINEPNVRFCDACGAAIAAEPAADSVRAQGRHHPLRRLSARPRSTSGSIPESVSRVMEAYHATVRTPIEAHGGTLVQLLGDGVMCAFGVPEVAEDDALRAVRAAVAVQQAFRASWPAPGARPARSGCASR